MVTVVDVVVELDVVDDGGAVVEELFLTEPAPHAPRASDVATMPATTMRTRRIVTPSLLAAAYGPATARTGPQYHRTSGTILERIET